MINRKHLADLAEPISAIILLISILLGLIPLVFDAVMLLNLDTQKWDKFSIVLINNYYHLPTLLKIIISLIGVIVIIFGVIAARIVEKLLIKIAGSTKKDIPNVSISPEQIELAKKKYHDIFDENSSIVVPTDHKAPDVTNLLP